MVKSVERSCPLINWCCVALSLILNVCMIGSIAGIAMYCIKLHPEERQAFDDKFNLNWAASSYVVTNHSVISRRCCKYDTCLCALAVNSSKKCSSMLQDLESGDCNNNYYCCKKTCQTCADVCHDCGSTRCHYFTCNIRDCACVCDEYVGSQLCSIVCDNCYHVSAIIQYNTSTNTSILVTTSSIDFECGQSDTTCVANKKSIYPIGFRSPIWYSPKNVSNMTFVQPVNKEEYLESDKIFSIFVVSLIVLCVTLVINFMHCCCCKCSYSR